MRLAIIGTGLIGASIGLGARRRGIAAAVRGYDRDPRALELARQRGAIDEAFASVAEAARGAELVVLAVPVGQIAGVMRELGGVLGPDAVVTDVGSTKAGVVEAARATLPDPRRFVAAHPIAGSERSGPGAAAEDLFAGRLCVTTPVEETSPEALERVERMWQGLGATIRRFEVPLHDRVFALTSHLPHAAAFALTAVIGGSPRELPLEGLFGAGFQDTTRIAGSDVAMWRDIFLANREALAPWIEQLARRLAELAASMRSDDAEAIERLVEEAHRGRDRVQGGAG